VSALTWATADERQTLLDILGADPDLVLSRSGQTLIADKHPHGGDLGTAHGGHVPPAS
jgi:acyl-coenzyme A thioesterase PaaI-like protein